MPNDARQNPAALRLVGLLLLSWAWGCGDDADTCEAKNARFTAFVAAHRACQQSSDCVIIGECTGNADFTAVTVEAESEGLRLMTARCDGPHDGEIPSAVCTEGVCVADYFHPQACCNCPDASDQDTGL